MARPTTNLRAFRQSRGVRLHRAGLSDRLSASGFRTTDRSDSTARRRVWDRRFRAFSKALDGLAPSVLQPSAPGPRCCTSQRVRVGSTARLAVADSEPPHVAERSQFLERIRVDNSCRSARRRSRQGESRPGSQPAEWRCGCAGKRSCLCLPISAEALSSASSVVADLATAPLPPLSRPTRCDAWPPQADRSPACDAILPPSPVRCSRAAADGHRPRQIHGPTPASTDAPCCSASVCSDRSNVSISPKYRFRDGVVFSRIQPASIDDCRGGAKARTCGRCCRCLGCTPLPDRDGLDDPLARQFVVDPCLDEDASKGAYRVRRTDPPQPTAVFHNRPASATAGIAFSSLS